MVEIRRKIRDNAVLVVLLCGFCVGCYIFQAQHPYMGEVAILTTRDESPTITKDESDYPEGLLPDERIPLNTATVEDIDRLPEMGKQTALNVVIHRSLFGDFTELEQLMDVYGFGKATFEAVKPYITLGGAPT